MSNEPFLAREPTALGLAAFYEAVFGERGWHLPPPLLDVCKALADERIKKLLIVLGPGVGKSTLCSIAFAAWRLGINPAETILGISGGQELVGGFIRGVAELIEHSPVYHALFPATRPDRTAGWSTERGIFVTGRQPGESDASYFGAGIGSAALTGKHGSLIICDDLHTRETSQSVEACEKVISTYHDTIAGRAGAQGARFINVCRRWSPDDLYGHLADSGAYVTMTLPYLRREAKGEPVTRSWWDISIPAGLRCVFTEDEEAP